MAQVAAYHVDPPRPAAPTAGGSGVTELLSFGGGVNSTALAILLINEGWRGPIVFADTGCEWPETYEYMGIFEREWLRPRGLEITRLHPQRTPEFYRLRYTVPLYDYCWHYHMVPLAAVRFCTRLYKTSPIGKWAEARGIDTQLVAIDAGEAQRMSRRRRPLVKRGIDRDGCKRIIKAEGLPLPSKSGCYICPMKNRWRWRTLWQKHPELFEKAMLLEENAKNHRARAGALDPSGRITLRQRLYTYEHQMEMGI